MLAVYLRLPLSHAQTEKNIIVVRGGVVAEERKDKCVWSGSVRHSISGRAGLGAWGFAGAARPCRPHSGYGAHVVGYPVGLGLAFVQLRGAVVQAQN